MGGKKRKSGVEDLRKRAEEQVPPGPDPENLPVEEVQRLVHELKVHQIELEMQNDALREAQAELLESSSKYTDLYDFAPVGYLTVDERCTILEANLTLSRQLGIERSFLFGRLFANCMAPSDRNGFRSLVARIFEARGRETFETTLVRKRDGKVLRALLECMFVEDARGRRQCRISVTDISEQRRRAEEALEVYMKKLERSNKELQDFAFIASHDMQEPLRKIQSFGSRIVQRHAEALDDEGRDFLERMMKAAERMSEMVHGLLDYSRVKTRATPFAAVDLTRLVREVESDLEILIERRRARIEVGHLPTIEADPTQIRRLFQNIIGNALKFSGEDNPEPVVKIHAEPACNGPDPAARGRAHRIIIEDNGIGFDEKYLDRIFTLFQRLHGRSAYEGTGMGLAICRRIVEHHHGSITATSTPGHGAAFIITLPEKQPAQGS